VSGGLVAVWPNPQRLDSGCEPARNRAMPKDGLRPLPDDVVAPLLRALVTIRPRPESRLPWAHRARALSGLGRQQRRSTSSRKEQPTRPPNKLEQLARVRDGGRAQSGRPRRPLLRQDLQGDERLQGI